ncbi:MAG TPA: type IV toxin-antitoxin system AbiEi family antitoxin domain-containing protein [Egibacteraceae bacterium]|nr:type IV toxin-antitoxin system AbiEi family antitoxin domain-containing protein [Egibacteraceae bacterium]
MARDPLALLARFTAGQYGHVTVRQAATAGVTRQDLHRLTRRGLLVRAHPRVYRVAFVPVTREGRAMAAVLSAGPKAVLSFSWAAWLHGVDRVPLTREPEVTLPGRLAPELPGVTAHSTRLLERCDITTVRGIPVTSGARTSVDLADDRLRDTEIMALTDDLICRKATTRAWQHRRACALAAGRAGVGVIARITRPGAEDEFWSWLERRFDRDVVRAYGLPRPAYNVALHDERGRIGIADACWAGPRDVVVELDGLRFHRLTADRRRDSHKSNRYAVSGRIPQRFTYTDVVSDPAAVAAQLRHALRAAGHPAGVGTASSVS